MKMRSRIVIDIRGRSRNVNSGNWWRGFSCWGWINKTWVNIFVIVIIRVALFMSTFAGRKLDRLRGWVQWRGSTCLLSSPCLSWWYISARVRNEGLNELSNLLILAILARRANLSLMLLLHFLLLQPHHPSDVPITISKVAKLSDKSWWWM